MFTLELVAFVTTILCVVFTAKQNVICWPFGIVSVISLIGIYIIQGLYAQIILQSMFLIQCIVGWYNWGVQDYTKVHRLNTPKFIKDLMVFISIACSLAVFEIVDDNKTTYITTFMDYISAFLALLGNWYLTKKIIQAWPLFMSYNALLIVVLASKEIYSIALMNAILFFISLNGYRTWKKDLKTV